MIHTIGIFQEKIQIHIINSYIIYNSAQYMILCMLQRYQLLEKQIVCLITFFDIEIQYDTIKFPMKKKSLQSANIISTTSNYHNHYKIL